MSDIRDWFRDEAGNSAASPHGAPELMARSGVNDSAREVMASVKKFYDDITYRRIFESWGTHVRVDGQNFNIVDGVAAEEQDATSLLSVGQRIRMVDAGSTWTGHITVIGAYGASKVTITIAWVSPPSPDTDGPLTAPDYIEMGPKDMGTAAFVDHGTAATEVPLNSDLDAHVTKPENTLDVGFVDGHTHEQIEMAGARGRLNPNGGLDFWQRGTSFTGSTVLNNDDENVCADNFTIIAEGDDRVDVTRDSNTPGGVPVQYSMKFKVATVGGNQKHGIITFAELHDAYDVGFVGTTIKVSVSFWAKVGAVTGIDQLRAALLNLKVATPAAHPVSDWKNGAQGALTFESVNWQHITSGSPDGDLAAAITGTWTEFKIEGVDMDISSLGTGAIALAITVDELSIPTGPEWHLAAVQFNIGDNALPFIRQPYALEFARCQRYCETTFPEGTAPQNAAGLDDAIVAVSSGTLLAADWRFAVSKYKDPEVVTFNPGDIAPPAGKHWEDSASVSVAATSADKTMKGVQILGTGATDALVHRIAAYAHANIWGAN